MVTVRTLFFVATAWNWHVHRMFIHNTFLHRHLIEEVYICPLQVFNLQIPDMSIGLKSPYMAFSRHHGVNFLSWLMLFSNVSFNSPMQTILFLPIMLVTFLLVFLFMSMIDLLLKILFLPLLSLKSILFHIFT